MSSGKKRFLGVALIPVAPLSVALANAALQSWMATIAKTSVAPEQGLMLVGGLMLAFVSLIARVVLISGIVLVVRSFI
ncbi:MAG: hypothetical protein Aurels2KO_46990 [Aureliella sp.]